MSSTGDVNHLQIPLQELSYATDKFSNDNRIASGGFGDVYKGKSKKYGNIAVKMLDPRHGQGAREFKTEIALLSVYKHEHVVSLIGFCDEDGKKMLVYKYERRGSLDNYLDTATLTWIQRLQICLGAARGLRYLHDDVGPHHRILHRDVKSSNILLNSEWKAKISDFGLSRVGPANMQSTFLISNVCGTIGYIDPDYLTTGYLTQKSDVYSFGVVLFEVLCGRLARVIAYRDKRQFLTNVITIHWKNKTLDEIIYSGLRKQIKRASFLTFSSIAYQCLMSPNERPTMKKVVEQLTKALDNQLEPSGPWSDVLVSTGRPQEEASGSSDFPSSSTVFDVFIISKQESTHKTFADQLNNALLRQQVITCNYKLYGDTENYYRTVENPEKSQIVIFVFTKDYVDSSACLDELKSVMKKNKKGQTVIPVFNGVEPSELGSKTSYYGEALAKYEGLKQTRKSVEKWRKALKEAAALPGWKVTKGNESEDIHKIVLKISIELLGFKKHSKTSDHDTGLIGIEARMQELKSLLKVGSGDVHKVGIYGIWGSGKSTLASSIYDKISHKFEGCCFVKDVRDRSRRHGLKMLQEEILSNVLNVKVTLEDLEQGIKMMQKRFRQNSVLIVLDDVDHNDHLEMLAGSRRWFGDGSRIIFTTRNQDLARARNSLAHNVRMFDDEEAIELFSRRAFKKSKHALDFLEVSKKMVAKFGGHPSALIRLGSFLHGKDMSEWMSILDRLEGRRVNEILKEFKTPHDGLERKFIPRFFT